MLLIIFLLETNIGTFDGEEGLKTQLLLLNGGSLLHIIFAVELEAHVMIILAVDVHIVEGGKFLQILHVFFEQESSDFVVGDYAPIQDVVVSVFSGRADAKGGELGVEQKLG